MAISAILTRQDLGLSWAYRVWGLSWVKGDNAAGHLVKVITPVITDIPSTGRATTDFGYACAAGAFAPQRRGGSAGSLSV
jgi:hypothetical protein